MFVTAEQKLELLTMGAKLDVSCSSSGASSSASKGGTGNCHAAGICHSFTQDGRCISLLKILLSNDCVYDCAYCACRRSNDLLRVSMQPKEMCELVMGFYRRNYIEGLFLSSAVAKSPDHTMERLYQTVYMLRTEYNFGGYIHLKAIPGASPRLIELSAQYATRMSVNIELPSYDSLKLLAPNKSREAILMPMRLLNGAHSQQNLLLNEPERQRELYFKSNRPVIPAGQTTQMIVGATDDTDSTIIRLSQALYSSMNMKRVYYSAYIPINEDSRLPSTAPPLVRENRLYQADWLLRFYGFSAEEIFESRQNLSLDIDPKCDWALRHPELFPLEVNSAPHEMLIRVPGIGATGAWRIIKARRYSNLSYEDLVKMRIVLKRAKHFVTVNGKYYGHGLNDTLRLRMTNMALNEGEGVRQLGMFDEQYNL